jgi:hypothetical protein
MNTVTIYSVSRAAAKSALGRLASFNGMVYTSRNHANSSTLAAGILSGDKVKITSRYFTKTSLLEIARRAAGRGTVA